ncbi:MAG: DUF4296 domain-containing protein [Balneolaceae bacterium]
MKISLPILSLLLLLNGCQSEEPPEELLSEELYMEILTEMILTRGIAYMTERGVDEDSLRQAYRVELFDHYEVPPEHFTISHEYYQRDLEQQRDRLTHIREVLREEHRAVSETRPEPDEEEVE